MGILNTFYILFKSNAEDVIKGNKAIEKSTKETERSLKNTNEEAQKLGQSFVKTVDSLSLAGAAIASYSVIKNAVTAAADFNSQLTITARLTGQSAQNLKAMAIASEGYGGTREGALSNFQGLSNIAQSMGQNLDENFLRQIRGRIAGRSMPTKMHTLREGFGVTDPGLLYRLGVMDDKQFEESVKWSKSLANLSPEAQQIALERMRANAAFNAAKDSAGTDIGNEIYPWLNDIKDAASKHPMGALAGSAAVAGGSAIGAGVLVKSILARIGIGSASAAAATLPAAAVPAAVGTAGLGGGFLAGYYGLGAFSKPIENWLVRRMGQNPELAETPLVRSAKAGAGSDMDFWMSRGYSSAQAAGIIANMKHESGGDPNARGDSGNAHGLFQWQNTARNGYRRDQILKATGIDVSTASHQKQLEAAAWEMQNGSTGFNDKYFRTLTNAGQAAAYFSNQFEYPHDRAGQALARAKTALGMAAGFSAAGRGGGSSVSIDKIEIVTQATDAKGIASDLKEELFSALSMLAAQFDDGVDK